LTRKFSGCRVSSGSLSDLESFSLLENFWLESFAVDVVIVCWEPSGPEGPFDFVTAADSFKELVVLSDAPVGARLERLAVVDGAGLTFPYSVLSPTETFPSLLMKQMSIFLLSREELGAGNDSPSEAFAILESCDQCKEQMK